MYTVGEIAKMANVSVRTLQYYDEIGLLKPNEKTEGGNRLYRDEEMVELQKITALKFMGYPLEKIKQILNSTELTWKESLSQQLQFILKEQNRLQKMEQATRAILQTIQLEEELNWKVVQQLMELYQQNNEQLEDYFDAHFTKEEQDLLNQIPHLGDESEQVNEWISLIKEVKYNLNEEPSSDIAQSLAKRWMDQVQQMFGDNKELQEKSWNEIKNDESPIGNYPLDPEIIQFIEKAVENLYKNQR